MTHVFLENQDPITTWQEKCALWRSTRERSSTYSKHILCDGISHCCEGFSMTNCNINGLQSTHTNSAFGKVGVGINQDFELAEHADQQITEISVNQSGQVGPRTLCEV